jgi:hypothetical protein
MLWRKRKYIQKHNFLLSLLLRKIRILTSFSVLKCSFLRPEAILIVTDFYQATEPTCSENIKYVSWLLTEKSEAAFLLLTWASGSLLHSQGLSGSGQRLAKRQGHSEQWLLVSGTSVIISRISKPWPGSQCLLTHLFTVDLVVATQIAGGGSADLSSSICGKESLC